MHLHAAASQPSACHTTPVPAVLLLIGLVALTPREGAGLQTPSLDPAPQGLLVAGGSETRDLMASAAHAWQLSLKGGEYVELAVEQRGANIRVRVVGPDGTVRYTFDDVIGGRAIETLKWIADASGIWTAVIAHTGVSRGGGYEITWAVRRAATAVDIELVAADSLSRAGRALMQGGRLSAADSLLRRSLAIRERLLGPDHLDVAAALHDVAALSIHMGRMADAEPLARRALRIRETKQGAEHLDVAATLTNLAIIETRLARYADAETTHRRALAINERLLGPHDVAVAGTLNNLALLLAGRQRFAEADTMFRRSLEITEAAFGPDHHDVARTLQNIAWLLTEQNRYADAEPLYRRALDISERALGAEHLDVGWQLYGLGWNQHQQGQYTEAEQLYRRSLQIWETRAGPDHPAVGLVLQNLAILFVDQARYSDAEPLHRRALAILEKANGPEHPQVAGSLNDIGVLYHLRGRYAEAEAAYRRAIAIRMKIDGPDHSRVGSLLSNVALLYNDQGRYAEAEPLYQRALAIAEGADAADQRTLANSLNNFGLLYSNQGRYAEAEPMILRALALTEAVVGPDHPEVAVTLRNLGNLYAAVARPAEAETAYRRALAIEEKVNGPESLDAAGTLGMLGDLYARQGRYAEAEPLQRRAIEFAERAVGQDDFRRADLLTDLAETLWVGRREGTEARALVDRAIDIIARHAVHPATQIEALTLRARIRREAGDTTAALTDLVEAIRTAEERRPQIGGGEETRAAFFSRYAAAYELMVEWQIEAGSVERAFEFAERGRARVLLDQLAAGKIDLRESIPRDVREPLVARETHARTGMAEYRARINRLRGRRDLSDDERARQAAALEDSLRAAERNFRVVYEEIKNASPLWRDLITTGGQPISLGTVQRRVVPADGFLMLYQIGEQQSYLFLVPTGIGTPEVVRLRIGADNARSLGVEAGAVTASLLDQVLLRDAESDAARTAAAPALGGLLGQAPVRGIGRRDQERASLERLHSLWRVLVPDTVWQRIRSAQQVVLVPGRGLHLLPFEALVVVPDARAANARYWLDEGPSLRYAASASMIYNLEQRASTRLVPVAGGTTVLSLSDPAFGADVAVQVAAAEPTPTGGNAPGDVTRSSFIALGGSLALLPGTAAETEAIRRAFSGSTFSVLALQGAEATETRLRPALSGMRYLHLATHGIIDDQRGALFAALALTPPAVANADDDGFLQLHEIYQLRLPQVELAVLSACETNVGAAIEGEGVFALSRGFFAAGARRVIASHWAVDDRSTAEIVGVFFGEIAADESAGRVVDFVSALRAAKLAVRQNSDWAHPYFWAPFVLTGAR